MQVKQIVVLVGSSILATFLATFLFLNWRHEKRVASLNDTWKAETKRLGEALQAKGNLTTNSELKEKIQKNLGKEVSKEIGKGNITTYAQAKGEVPESTHPLSEKPYPTNFNFTLSQNRGILPSLTTLNFNYDPLNPAVEGNWNNHKEVFQISSGEWRTEKGGLRVAIRLQREVFKGESLVGREEIPLEEAEVFFSQDKVQSYQTLPLYTLCLGSTYDPVLHRVLPAGYIERKVGRRFGVSVGFANGGYFLGGSYSF